MNYNVKSEIITGNGRNRYDVTIVRGGSLNIFTTIPVFDDKRVFFDNNEKIQISYYFGQFVYTFDVAFVGIVEENKDNIYQFSILGVEIEKNFRKEQRRNVSFKAVFLNLEGIDFAHILDISEGGMRIETERPIRVKTIEVFFEEGNDKVVRRGDVVWAKEFGDKYQYGVKFN